MKLRLRCSRGRTMPGSRQSGQAIARLGQSDKESVALDGLDPSSSARGGRRFCRGFAVRWLASVSIVHPFQPRILRRLAVASAFICLLWIGGGETVTNSCIFQKIAVRSAFGLDLTSEARPC